MAESLSNSLFDLWNKLQGVFSSEASSSSPLVVPKLTELHEMVYEVYKPPLDEKPELEIVFLHGLKLKPSNEAHITTWMSEDNSEFWPLTWLVEAYPRARILTVLYDSAAKRTNEVGRLDMFLTTENLLSALTSHFTRVGEAECPIVLVGHCLGGLLLKEVCLHANKVLSEKREEMPGMPRISDFFNNLRGMFFYGTPHLGSLLGDKLQECFDGSLLAEIEIFNAWSSRKNASFCDLKSRYKWQTYGMGETRETFVDCLGKSFHVVPEASSRSGMDTYYSVDADHYNLCKPKGEQASSFSCLRDFLHQIHEECVLRSGVEADALSGRGYVVDFFGRAEKVKSMIAQADAHTTFIVGLTGIGKTTLAQQVFHDISQSFAINCFIYLDNFESHANSKEDVLRKIEIALKRQGKGSNYDYFNVPQFLKGKKVLIILDNVQSQSQLDALGREIWLEGNKSRLVVTTTDPGLGSRSNTFVVKYLWEKESRELFHHYAFAHRAKPEGLENSIKQVIERCGNFPLSLKILGSYLSAQEVNDQCLWKDLNDRLRNAEEVANGPDYRLWARLRPCYDGLTRSEQEMFLDVALVFCGLPLNLVEHIWSACRLSPSMGWRNLKRGFLVNVREDGTIRMHGLLKNLGRSIACPQRSTVDKWSRISAKMMEIDFIAKYQGVMETRSLELRVQVNERLTLTNTTLAQYVKLEYLILDGVEMTEGSVELPRSLAYLKWKGASFEVCPVDFKQLKKLAVLDLQYCKTMKSLPSIVMIAKNLKWLELEGCQSLTELPEGLYEFSNLDYLGLSNTGLTKLPSKVRKLKNLRYLKANQTQLTRVPKSIGGLRVLQSLDISNTPVRVLPESICDLQFLTKLHARKTLLNALPESIGRVRMLEDLNISNTAVRVLPESICDLQFLTKLYATKTSLTALPESIGRLGMLDHLDISKTNVRVLPDSVGDLNDLTFLYAEKTLLSSLPDSIGRLRNLEELGLSHTRMKGLPESLGNAAKLRVLELDFTPLDTLPDSLGKLHSLEILDLNDTRISTLPDAFGGLEKLQWLKIQGSKVRSLPETFNNLSRLIIFHLSVSTILNDGRHSGSRTLSTISGSNQDFGSSSEFECELDGRKDHGGENAGIQEEGETLAMVPYSPSARYVFSKVGILQICGEGCKQSLLPTLFRTLETMTILRDLTLSSFNEVEALPSELGMLTRLTFLTIKSCEKLRELPESLGLLQLSRLILQDLPALRRLPEYLGKFCAELRVWNCGRVESMPSSFGHTSPLDRDSSTACGDECATSCSSPALYDKLPHFETDSWRLLRCLLECGKNPSCRRLNFCLKCEEMERVMKKAEDRQETLGAEDWRGRKFVKFKVATTVLRELYSECHTGDDDVHGTFEPSTVWLPLNDLGDKSTTAIYLQCGCAKHIAIVRVLDSEEDREDREEESDEGDSEEDREDREEESDEGEDEEDLEDIEDSEEGREEGSDQGETKSIQRTL